MSICKKLNGGREENSCEVNWSWLGEREEYSVKYLIAKSKLTVLKDFAVLFRSTVEKYDSLSEVFRETC